MNLLTAFQKEWKEALRSYRFLIVIVVLVLFGLFSPLLAKLGPEILTTALPMPEGFDISQLFPPPTVKDAVIQYIKNMGQSVVILALLFSMGAVAQEKEKGTAAMMLVKPLPRGSFIGAKFLSQAALFAIAILIAAVGCYYYTMLLFEAMDVLPWLVLNAFLFLYTLVIVAITLFCSTITRSQSAAAGLAVAMIASGWIAGAIRGFGKYLPGELNTWGARLVLGDATSSWIALGISFGLIVAALLAAWLIFRRQEL